MKWIFVSQAFKSLNVSIQYRFIHCTDPQTPSKPHFRFQSLTSAFLSPPDVIQYI